MSLPGEWPSQSLGKSGVGIGAQGITCLMVDKITLEGNVI